MNTYELEKRATPGPLVCDHTTILDSEKIRVVGDIYVPDVVHLEPERYAQMEADALLLVHCRNNFIRVLSALKMLVDEGAWVEVDTGIGTTLESSPAREDAKRLIAELEEVK